MTRFVKVILLITILPGFLLVGGPALAKRPLPLRWAVYTALFFGIVLLGVDGGAQFIYFQF